MAVASTVLAAMMMSVTAQAQTASNPALRRLEAAVAIAWLSGAGAGVGDANLRTAAGGDYRLFSTDSRFDAAAGIEARVAYPLTRRYTVEGRVGFSRPELSTSVSDDVENAPAVTLVEALDQYVVEGAVVVMFDALGFGALVPFASAGAGYLRQLHEGQTLVEEGIAYQVGGGVRRQLFGRTNGFVKGAGFRGDGRVYLVTGGVELDDGLRTHFGLSAGFFVNF